MRAGLQGKLDTAARAIETEKGKTSVRKILIAAAAMAAIAGPAGAGEKTFDETFPVTESIEDWCKMNPRPDRDYTKCFNDEQGDYDYAKNIWSGLSDLRKETCGGEWVRFRYGAKTPGEATYESTIACLNGAQDDDDHDTVRLLTQKRLHRFIH